DGTPTASAILTTGGMSGCPSYKPCGKRGAIMAKPRIYTMSFANVYPAYVAKAEKKGRTKDEVDEIIRWLTGYSQAELQAHLEKGTDLETFILEAPNPNPNRRLITGVICGYR